MFFKEENEGEQNKERKEREERKRGKEEREPERKWRRGQADYAETPCGLFPHLPRSLQPTASWGRQAEIPGLCGVLPTKMALLLLAPAAPRPGLPQSALLPLSVIPSKDHHWPHAWPSDCKLFPKEHFAMGFPSPETILGMSIASVWNKNAELVFLINNDIVISCHSDGR